MDYPVLGNKSDKLNLSHKYQMNSLRMDYPVLGNKSDKLNLSHK